MPESGQIIDFVLVFLWTAYKRQEVCNWADRQRLIDLYDAIADGQQQITDYPVWMMFAQMSLPVKDSTRLQLARKVSETFSSQANDRRLASNTTANRPLRIAYMGANFHNHPNYYITKSLFGAHNRARVHVSIYCLNRRIPAANEAQLIRSTDIFRDVATLSDDEIAQTIRDDQIDVLIDLGTYNDSARPGVQALRPAPIQISWQGSEMSSGAEYYDYRITDEFLIAGGRELWSEKMIYVPGTSYHYDQQQELVTETCTRLEQGLPENAFVFCSFNNSHKIEPEMFASWCNILRRVDNAVLWLLVSNQLTQNNLKKHALDNGVDPDRLVFADRVKHAEHLGRHSLADLFLDSKIYNAHTTAAECLWAGIPLLTICGTHSASRVAASILHAVGLSELVTNNLGDYEGLAVKIASNPSYLDSLKLQTGKLRESDKLFDNKYFASKMETAYESAWQQYQARDGLHDIEIREVRHA